jgi:hypothetical protein
MYNDVFCFNCQKKLDLPKKIPFRALCDYCSFYQHCCKNCTFYKPGFPNECKIEGTEPVNDRLQMNFCEDFSLKAQNSYLESSVKEIESKLFGSNQLKEKKDFNSLFKDE